MAAKRAASGKCKGASSRPKASGSRGGGRSNGGAGGFLTKVVLYPLAIAGGLYIGVQAHALYGSTPLPIPWPEPEGTPKRAASVKPAAARQPRRVEVEWPRSRSTRREAERQRKREESPAQKDPASAGRPGDEVPAKPAPDEENASQIPTPGPAPAPEEGAAPKVESPVSVRPITPAPAPGFRKASPVPAVEIDRGVGARPEVALTFDAGADYRPAARILDTLAAEGVRCTFFLTGEWVQRNPKTSRRIAAEGHEIGNHSWDHPPFTQLSTAEIQDQLRRTEAVIRETTGRTSRPYFRPPLGARDNRVRQIVGSEGFLTVYWTLDSRDSVDKGITAAQIRDRVLGGSRAGSIVLLHCGSQATADALPEILKGLKSRGLTPVAVSRLLEE